MSRLPRVTGRELILALRKAGFESISVRGSHHHLRHADGRKTIVPIHSNEVIGPGLLARILRSCEMTPDQLRDLL
jgi:predicted RNA binding protein YcfA (HicA-like mRNA interferase family)